MSAAGPVSSLRGKLTTALIVCSLFTASPAAADTLFWEDFDGYSSFPDEQPSGDFVNKGLPKVSEGADQTWYGVRFEGTGGTENSINKDLFVEKCGDFAGFNCQSASGSGNKTPVGRFEDDAGILLEISTTNYTDITLDFDWRTSSTNSRDWFRAGYLASSAPISFTTYDGGGYADLRTGAFAWSNWTELLKDRDAPFQSAPTFALPSGADYLYVAFWLDNGENDHGKLDNVHIQGTLIPEPATGFLVAVGLVALAGARRRP
ncbi:MAG: PEP-CTERM sorting domain-containing protein [Deltaproteobacteria bacterium]|nr:PEP-CTERM sorting domain-containing protein [Deltaproteobacteria bacterium]